MSNKAFDSFWYLREGDLNPEPLSSLQRLYGYINPSFIEELRIKGLLFASKQDAHAASDVAKRALANMSRKHHESTHKQAHTHESLLHQVRENASPQYRCDNCPSRKRQHNRQIALYQADVSNPENHPKIEITIRL